MVIETKKGRSIPMTREQLDEAIESCKQNMDYAIELHNSAETLDDKRTATAMYDAFAALHKILLAKREQAKREDPPNNKWRYYLD